MTPDERELLTQFLDDLRRVPNGPRDAEAARMIEDALSGRPESIYLLVQHALLADQALYEAQRRIAALEDQVNAAAPASRSFLRPSPSPWGNDRGTPPPGPRENPGFSGGALPPQQGGFSSFLRNSAATAAGLAGGAFLFEGLSNLFGSHHTGTFLGGGMESNIDNAGNQEHRFPGMPQDAHEATDVHEVADTDDDEYYDDNSDDVGGGDLDNA